MKRVDHSPPIDEEATSGHKTVPHSQSDKQPSYVQHHEDL